MPRHGTAATEACHAACCSDRAIAPARVAVLETIAAQTSVALVEIKQEMRDFRQEMRDFRSEFRRNHDRDFRITFGAIITTTVGLAVLIAHVAHWL